MSIGNHQFSTKKIPIPNRYLVFLSKFLGIFLVFYRYFENGLVQIWLNIGIFLQEKIGLLFSFCGCHFIGIGLVSVCHFPENDNSNGNIWFLHHGRTTRAISMILCMHVPSFFVIFCRHSATPTASQESQRLCLFPKRASRVVRP